MSVVLDTPWAGTAYSPALRLDVAHVEQVLVDYLRGIQQSGLESSDPVTVAVAQVLRQVAVDHFPEQPEKYRLTHRVGQVLITYGGSESSPDPTTVDEVRQERTGTWHFDVVVRDLGWAYGGQPSGPSPGAYGVLEALRLALCGYVVPGYTKMVFVRERFVKRDSEGAVWYYEAEFAHRCVIIENDVQPNYPTFSRLTSLERGGVTTVDVPDAAYTFDANGAISLPHGNVSNVVVSDPATGAAYDAGLDYLLDYIAGTLSTVEGGVLTAGDTVNVSYSHAEILIVES
jgi:hypothetical protein